MIVIRCRGRRKSYNWVKSRIRGGNQKIKSVRRSMSRKIYIMGQSTRRKNREKFINIRIRRTVKVKIKVANNYEVIRSSRCSRKKS